MTESLCTICLCPTDHTLSPDTCGCTFPVHEACGAKLYKCVYCNKGFNRADGTSECTEADLTAKLMTAPYHLVNSYFYNSHDLKILLNQYGGDNVHMVSYANAEGNRHVMSVERNSPLVSNPTAFRTQLMNFHKSFRVQFVFMATNLPIDASDESIRAVPSETVESLGDLWALKFQPKW